MEHFRTMDSHPGPMASTSTSSSPGDAINHLTACQRCRKQKLRCSREKPTCKRCEDVSAVCFYPPPPDRKLLAAQRTQNAQLRASRRREMEKAAGSAPTEQRKQSNASSVPSDSASPVASVGQNQYDLNHQTTGIGQGQERWQASWNTTATAPSSVTSSSTLTLPSLEVALFLIDIYFSHLYSATLLFHKDTFVSDYTTQRVPNFVSLSIFAIASIFLRGSSKTSYLDENGVEPAIYALSIADCSRHSFEWANHASREVLVQSDEPRLETVQACQNLALYWFSLDRKDRTNIHTHLAYRTCRLLGFHNPPEESIEIDSTYGEVRRRCFWSCWITACISQENASFKGESWSGAIRLPFPSDEESFQNRDPVPMECFDDHGDIVSLDKNARMPRDSVMAELVKIFGLWWEIQRFVKKYGHGEVSASPDRISVLMSLDRQLELFYDNLHPNYHYADATSFSSSKIDAYRLFSIHCIYHLCACVLHSSIVPVFSKIPYDPKIPKKVLRLSTSEAVSHSLNMLNMSSAFLSVRPNKARLPSFIGYAMFVATSIQFKSLVAQGRLRAHGTGRFEASLAMMVQLKEYWRPLQGLWIQLEIAFRSVGININGLSSSYNRPQATVDDAATDIDRIASQNVGGQRNDSDIYTYVTDQEPNATSPEGLSPGSSEPIGPVPRAEQTTPKSVPATMPQSAPSHYAKRASQSHIPRVPDGFDASSNAATQYSNMMPMGSMQQPGAQFMDKTYPMHFNQASIPQAAKLQPQRQMQPMDAYEVMDDAVMMDVPGGGAAGLWWDQSFQGANSGDPIGFLLGDRNGYFFPPG